MGGSEEGEELEVWGVVVRSVGKLTSWTLWYV